MQPAVQLKVLSGTTLARAQETESGAVVPSILAFDVNESMLDIQHLGPLFKRLFGDEKFVNELYAKFVLDSEGMDPAGSPYVPFFDLSQAMLKMMGSIRSVSIRQADIDELETLSAAMPAHPDVPAGLKQLKDAGFRLVTLTNSSSNAQVKQLRNAGIDGFFERKLSVDGVRRYKPAQQVYHMAAEELNVPTSACQSRVTSRQTFCGMAARLVSRTLSHLSSRAWN